MGGPRPDVSERRMLGDKISPQDGACRVLRWTNMSTILFDEVTHSNHRGFHLRNEPATAGSITRLRTSTRVTSYNGTWTSEVLRWPCYGASVRPQSRLLHLQQASSGQSIIEHCPVGSLVCSPVFQQHVVKKQSPVRYTHQGLMFLNSSLDKRLKCRPWILNDIVW